jgi:hypothetical protein
MELTINKALVLQKKARERINGLRELRSQVAVEETRYFGDQSKEKKEPLYDVKKVDKMISALQKLVFDLDMSIKESNAIVKLKLDNNESEIDSLFNAIE